MDQRYQDPSFGASFFSEIETGGTDHSEKILSRSGTYVVRGKCLILNVKTRRLTRKLRFMFQTEFPKP